MAQSIPPAAHSRHHPIPATTMPLLGSTHTSGWRARCFSFAWQFAWLIGITWLAGNCLPVVEAIQEDPRESFFEKEIRPIFVEHCYGCHANDAILEGELALDSPQGWQRGGRSGPALVPGDPQTSLLMRVIHYDDAQLRMPPAGKLRSSQIAAIQKWIEEGAFDPRPAIASPTSLPSRALTVEQAHLHWAYRPRATSVIIPWGSQRNAERGHPVDAFIEDRLKEHSLTPLPEATPETLLRRLSMDLLGLPPTRAELEAFLAQDETSRYTEAVDRMLASRRFAEKFARHWLDVARYAESLTLRGFILPDTWRFRDYCIDSIDMNKPWDAFLREQMAGDLLDELTSGTLSVEQRQQYQIATTFLLMGNHNLEEQDKPQLEMDVVDEQLDTLGKALLGQTLGCARCHDHKFDPIPTRDYYALAGILRSSNVLQHENVSKWLERPLTLAPDEEEQYRKWEKEKKTLQEAIAMLQKKEPLAMGVVDPSGLSGIVVDDRQAKIIGDWTVSTSVKTYVGQNYLHDGNREQGKKTVTFEPASIAPGSYEIRLAYSAGTNRSSRTSVRIFSADGDMEKRVDQRVAGEIQGLWTSLGTYRFETGGQCFVILSNDEADGHVIADAIQFLPSGLLKSNRQPTNVAQVDSDLKPSEGNRLAEMEGRIKEVERLLSRRPKCMGLIANQASKDLRVHLRGSIHTLGAIAPRGFLSVFPTLNSQEGRGGELDRLALANWIVAPDHPLTARVFVNRVWLWLMGEGLVRSPDNFGTTGESPSHPELLDWLANDLVEHDWSLKRLVRTIVTSAAYRRATHPGQESSSEIEADPENRWLWRGPDKRLDAESLRDAMLWISGELQLDTRGPQYPADLTADFSYRHTQPCRSLFVPAFRNSLNELLNAFDLSDPSVTTGQRQRTTVAQQALLMLNSPWVAERAQVAAMRLCQELALSPGEVRNEASRHASHRWLTNAAWVCWGREPTASELQILDEQLQASSPTLDDVAALSLVLRAMFGSVSFRYLD